MKILKSIMFFRVFFELILKSNEGLLVNFGSKGKEEIYNYPLVPKS